MNECSILNKVLTDRLLSFSVTVIKLLRRIPDTPEYKIIKHQLIKSSTSSGANYEESQGASSRSDFKNKIFIALKEMRESNYWLNILAEIVEDKKLMKEIILLKNESDELKKILGSIVTKINKQTT